MEINNKEETPEKKIYKKIEIKYFPIDGIKKYDKNPRKNSKAIPIVKKSIESFGFRNPIIIDKDNVIIAGHTRLEASKELGYTEVPVIYADDLTPEQVNAFRIMDNKSQEYSLWDYNLLEEELKTFSEKFDLSLTGFRESEIFKLLDQSRDAIKGDYPGKYKIERNKVYKLGRHRLICGDSTEEETFIKLIPKGTEIHCIYTDPPYGVSYSGTNNENGRDWDVIAGDNLRGNELYNFLEKAFKNFNQFLIKGGGMYIFHASSNQIIFEKALNSAGFQVKQQLIWHKHHILGHSHYHWTHEPIFYCSRINENPNFYGTRDNKTFLTDLNPENMTKEELVELWNKVKKESSVVEFKKDPPKDYIHPTQKPVKMAEHFIINSSRLKENILEPFAGSGSTLIACENRNRTCYAIEYSPDFCSHIIERWEKLTGNKATGENGEEILLK